MHRNERIAQAISTLQAIEKAVEAVMADPTTTHIPDRQAYIDNVVRLYCASDVASAAAACAPI